MRVELAISGLDQVRAQINGASKQIKFAASRAINDAANAVRKEMPAVFGRQLDRPRPFTKAAVAARYSTREKLEATVFIKPIQAAYLRPVIEGGERQEKKIEQRFMGRLFTPTDELPLDVNGNVSKATQLAIVRALTNGTPWKGRRLFVIEQRRGRLAPGVYAVPIKRTRRQLADRRALLWFVERANYRKKLDFYGEAARIANATLGPAFERRFDEALRSAR
jgi:hypothetical protein